MKTILETVLYKRTPDELEKICKDVNASRSWRITVNGKLNSYSLFNSVTRERKYKWEKGKSRLPFKEWYSKYCPKVSHDYTLGELMEDAIRSPVFHISMALIWITISSYINYYKLTNTVSEDYENKLAACLIVSSGILHYLLYFFLLTVARPFSYKYIRMEHILMSLFLLLNPITIPTIILSLNMASVEGREIYKNYLWKLNIGFSALYGLLGLLMGWVTLWFWI
jgi:hypothetical protein